MPTVARARTPKACASFFDKSGATDLLRPTLVCWMDSDRQVVSWSYVFLEVEVFDQLEDVQVGTKKETCF